MATSGGWQQLIPDIGAFRGAGNYPIAAYSEFMPPPRLGWKPYPRKLVDPLLFTGDDPWGWHVTEYQESQELQPGLLHVAQRVAHCLWHLHRGDPAHGIARRMLHDNPYWPEGTVLPEAVAASDRCLMLMPLALSRTQDDKGRVCWTVFGTSEQGPAKAFWRSFYASPESELPAEYGLGFFCHLLQTVFDEPVGSLDQLREAGFRILPQGPPPIPSWDEGPLPSWTKSLLLSDDEDAAKLKYVLTFRPLAELPAALRSAYLGGELHLLPSPSSLVFWGARAYWQLAEQLPLALQIPLLSVLSRRRATQGMRVPQAGVCHEPSHGHAAASSDHGPIRNTFKRTHRWDRILRDADELALLEREDKLLGALFSIVPDDMGLYDKPMARNVQIWSTDPYGLLLDGPHASSADMHRAMEKMLAGGHFGYRMEFPAMRVGRHEVYWQRPLVAYRRPADGEAVLLSDAPLGYLTAYPENDVRLDRPVELWPRLLRRPLALASLSIAATSNHQPSQIARNIRKLISAHSLLGGRPLPRSFTERLLTIAKDETLDDWLRMLPDSVPAAEVEKLIEPTVRPLPRRRASGPPDSLTYGRTATRAFEVAYWKTIASLAEGTLLNKNNADCVRDQKTESLLPYHQRQLELLGEHLLAYYGRKIAAAASREAVAGEMRFLWQTEFEYPWMEGWQRNRTGPAERNIVVTIPGRDCRRAVIMADHYDTAYMEDRYEPDRGGCGARLAACGADDNHSATAALMLAAPVFLQLSREGQLACDVWLVHLTGEEFPADCLGARVLTQRLVEGTLEIEQADGQRHDLSQTEIVGVYVSDMIAHNNDHHRNVFQIAPGTTPQSFELAYQAHLANEIWNASAPTWNKRATRRGRPPGRRSPHGAAVPEIAPHLALRGEVRPPDDPRSTLFNTDGQIFSDAGVPVVLFMENYDINRHGYHDTQDTMANIDLDYGAALAAIVIESVARAASE